MIISWQMAADRDRYLEKYAFPFCAKQADKYEKVAKIGQVHFSKYKDFKSVFSSRKLFHDLVTAR